jgi:hypothetical protein
MNKLGIPGLGREIAGEISKGDQRKIFKNFFNDLPNTKNVSIL